MSDSAFDWISDNLVLPLIVLIVAASAIGLLAALGYGLFGLADNAFTQDHETCGTVEKVDFVPAHSVTEYNVALKMPTTRTVPAEWHMLIATRHGSDWFCTGNPAGWMTGSAAIGVRYSYGRITRRFCIVSIYRLTA